MPIFFVEQLIEASW